MTRIALLFAVEAPEPRHVHEVQELLARLRVHREGATGAPEFVNEVDEASRSRPDDEPIWTLGGVLRLDPPSSGDHERHQFDDVVFLLDELRRVSQAGLKFVIEYNGEEIGCVSAGRIDRSLTVGLVDEWRRRLALDDDHR